MMSEDRPRPSRPRRLLFGVDFRRSGVCLVRLGSCLTLLAVCPVSAVTVAVADGSIRDDRQPVESQEAASASDVGEDSNTAADLAALIAAGLGPYDRDDEFADAFSWERAAQFLDRVAVTWGDTFGCVTCHTNGYYLTAPSTLFTERPAFRKARQQAEAFVRLLDPDTPTTQAPAGEEDPYGIEDTYVVATAAFLAINDRQAGEDLSPITVQALDRAWSIQDEDGHWPGWFKCNWPPFESDDHYGVTLMAIATGMAPESYSKMDVAVQGMARIRGYLATHPPEHTHHKAMLLWLSRYHEDLVDDSDRQRWIDELLNLQRPDGGWASGDLGAWRQRDGNPADAPVHVESDGYGTGFVIYTLRQAGVPASHPSLQKGVDWLKTHQRGGGYWWTQSLRNDPYTANFLTHAGTTFALKALVASYMRNLIPLVNAWVPRKGEVFLSLSYQFLDAGDHLLSDPVLFGVDLGSNSVDLGTRQSQVLVLDGDIGITDRLAVNAAVAFVSARYLEGGITPFGPTHAEGPLDDGAWHSDFQDGRIGAQFMALNNGTWVLTPVVSYGFPATDYVTSGQAALGRHLNELRLGVDWGRLLSVSGAPKAYLQGSYAYAFMEDPDQVSLDRSNLSFELGYFLPHFVTLRVFTDWQNIHGGTDWTRDLEDVIGFHDRTAATDFWRLGGGITYPVSEGVDLYGNVATTLWGRNTRDAITVNIGVSWGFPVFGVRR